MPDESHRTGVDPDETEEQARARRTREAYATLDDDDGVDARLPPYPVPGLGGAIDMLRAVPADHVRGVAELRAVAAGESWQALDSIGRAACAAWMRLKLRRPKDQHWQVAVGQILGTLDRGRWRDAPAAPAGSVEFGEADAAAWIKLHMQPPSEELVPEAPGLCYSRRMVLVHAKRGQGKTTYCSFLVARALRAGLRVMLAVDDDPESWAAQLTQWEAAPLADLIPLDMAALAPAGALEAAVEHYQPNIVIVDSWRRWASASGARKRGDLYDEAVCGPIADRLVEVARSGPSVVGIANEAKEGESSRGSVAPEDSANGAVRRLTREGDVTTIATADNKSRHGLPYGPWHMRLNASGFEPDPDHGERAKIDAHKAAVDTLSPAVHAFLAIAEDGPQTINQIQVALKDQPDSRGQKGRAALTTAINIACDLGTVREVPVKRNGRPYVGFEAVQSEHPFASAEHPPADANEPPIRASFRPPFRGADDADGADAPKPERPQTGSGGCSAANDDDDRAGFDTAAAVSKIPEWLHQPARPAMDDVPDDLPLVPGDTIRMPDGRQVPVLSLEDWRAIHFPADDGWRRRTA